MIAEHEQRFTTARVGCVGLEVKRLLLARVFADLREVQKQFHPLRLAEVVTRENLLCHFHAARDVANHAKLDVQMVEQPRRHFRVWDAAENAEVAVVAARLFVVRQMLNHHALILDGLHRLNRELVMLMHRANPFARAAQHHALTRDSQPFAVNGIGEHEARICAALGVLANEIRAAQEDVVRVAPENVGAGCEVVCGLPRLGEVVNVRPIFVPRRVLIDGIGAWNLPCQREVHRELPRVVRFLIPDGLHDHNFVRDWRK